MNSTQRLWLNGLACSFIFAPADLIAAQLRVPSEHATIVAALDAANEGDEVIVAPGVYSYFETRQIPSGGFVSSVGFLKKGVVLVSESGPDVTELRMDSTVGGPVILRYLGPPGDARVDGFTFTGAVPELIGLEFSFSGRCVVQNCNFRDFGTGLSNELGVGGISSDIELHNCKFENIQGRLGAGINGVNITLVVEDCDFTRVGGNVSDLKTDISFPHVARLEVRRSHFIDNGIVPTLQAGILVYDFPFVIVEDCAFSGAECTGSACALTINGENTIAEVRGCTFAHNRNTGAGSVAGISVRTLDSVVENNTFSDNSIIIDWTDSGAAARLTDGVEFRNNVIHSSSGGKAVNLVSGSISSSCNVYWNNPLGNTSGFTPDPTDIEADPLFCAPESDDFTLNSASPCLPGNHPLCSTLIGAYEQGCGTVSVAPQSWGRIKGLYRATTRGESR